MSDQQLRQALRQLPGWSDVEVRALIEGCRALLRARAKERRAAERALRLAQAETTAQRARRVLDGMCRVLEGKPVELASDEEPAGAAEGTSLGSAQ